MVHRSNSTLSIIKASDRCKSPNISVIRNSITVDYPLLTSLFPSVSCFYSHDEWVSEDRVLKIIAHDERPRERSGPSKKGRKGGKKRVREEEDVSFVLSYVVPFSLKHLYMWDSIQAALLSR